MEISNLKKITLPNRDRADLYLVQAEENSNLYKLVCDTNHKYVLDYACITLFEDNTTIYAFDPAGGPYLYVGYMIDENRKIQAIIPFEDDILFIIGT